VVRLVHTQPCQAKIVFITVVIKTSSLQPPSLAGWHRITFKIHAPEDVISIFQKFKIVLGGGPAMAPDIRTDGL